MEKDFHYYLVYALARTTGYQSPDIIAYSSQFVDDNNEGQFSIDGEETGFPDKIEAAEGYYYPIMTQSLSPKSLDIYVQRYVYVPFHFLPGDNNVEIKMKKNKLSTTPNSKNAQSLLNHALQSNDPYQIGLALHTFADTWSHQNFTGLREDWNSVYPWYEIFKSIVPNIGHAEAGHSPDIISDTWADHRLKTKIDNQERAFDATKNIYTMMRSKSQSGPEWYDVKNSYEAIIKSSDYDSRIKAISDFMNDNGHGAIPDYSKDKWIDDALEKKEDNVVMKPDFTSTDWYKFHQAAKRHFAHVTNLIKAL